MNKLRNSIFETISEHTPFSVEDIQELFDQVNSIDKIIITCEYAGAQGYATLNSAHLGLMDTAPRNNKSAKIAAFLDSSDVVINRGFREKVEQGDFYSIPSSLGHGTYAIFQVKSVEMKMSFLELVWVSKTSQETGKGTEMFLLDPKDE